MRTHRGPVRRGAAHALSRGGGAKEAMSMIHENRRLSGFERVTHERSPVPGSSTAAAPRRGGRYLAWWLTAVVFGGVVTGSLLPFSFDASPGGVAELFGLARLGWYPSSLSDVLANIIVYAPVGAALAWGLAGAKRSRLMRVATALGIGVGMSVGLEWLQTLMSIRVSSWIDVCMNGTGTLIGVAAVESRGMFRPALDRAARALAWRPMLTVAKVLSVGLLMYHLVPFDFVTSSEAMWASMHQTRVWPTVGDVDAATQIAWVGYAGQFALLGFLCVLGLRERGRSVSDAVNAALTHVGVLALLIEVLQLFVASHAFDSVDFFVAASGGMLGVCAAAAVVMRRCIPSLRQVLGLVLLLQVMYLLASSAAPFDWVWPAAGWPGVFVMPFWGQFLRPFGAAMGSMLQTAVTYAVLAAVARSLLADRTPAWRMIGVVLTVMVVAAACEALQMLTATRHPDVTDPLIALCVAVGIGLMESPVPQRIKALSRIRTGRGA